MAYQSLYRRYRPQKFSEVRGQEHLVRALRNAVVEDRVGHAYLFSGPRGTGKTTSARILAKVLNCEKPEDGEPCGSCSSCLALEAGTSFDLHELDAASNNKVDDIRDLIEKSALGTPGRTKVYILDEVHMLTAAASNALLKTLEEPPDHVVFVLATTDPQKVLPTIRSRTQHFEVHLLPADELTSLVRDVAADAGLEIGDDEVDYVVRAGRGSARDTLSALDQVVAAGGVPSTVDGAAAIIEGLVDQDPGAVLVGVHDEVTAGREPRVLGESLLDELRNAFLAVMGADLSHLSDSARERADDVGRRLGARSITTALEQLGEALIEIRQAADPRIPLEVALVKVARPDSAGSLDALAARVDRLEQALRGGAAPPADPPPARSGGGEKGSTGGGGKGGRKGGGKDRAGDEGKGGAAAAEKASGRAGSSGAVDDPPPTTGGRPADGAREVLARKQAGRPASSPDGPESSATRASAPPAADPAPTDGSSALAPEPQPTSSAEPLSRDRLTLLWGDRVLPELAQAARTRFKDGRFLVVEGTEATFALPTKIHVDRAEDRRTEVEEALAAVLGSAVHLRLVVDEGSAAPPPEAATGPDRAPEPQEADDEIGPVDELDDAHDLEETHLERITQAFPGAEVIDDEAD